MENQNYIDVGDEEASGFGLDEKSAGNEMSWPAPAMVVTGSGGMKRSLEDAVKVRMDVKKKSDISGSTSHLIETWYESDLAKVAPGKEFMLVCAPFFLCYFHRPAAHNFQPLIPQVPVCGGM